MSRRSKISLLSKLLVAALGLAAGTVFYFHVEERESQIIHDVTIEAGSPISLDLFFHEMLPESSFITDVNAIDTNIPASYKIKIKVWKFTTNCVLNIVDTTPPTASAIPQLTYTDWLPDVSECITDINDLSQCHIFYTDGTPDISYGGEYDVNVSVVDAYNNVTIVPVPFTVIDDHIAPVIEGAHDMEYFTDETVLYRQGVTYSDNYDPNPSFEIDTSDVQAGVPGEYPVRYISQDEFGNTAVETVTLTLTERPPHYDDMLVVYEMAQEVIDSITTEDMSDMEKAFKIFYWARYNIHYIGTSTKEDWVLCALEGFTTYQGDCFTYYSCCKAMLDVLGIENMFVERYPIYYSHHYWNLVNFDGQWYHCDATPSSSHEGFYFMYTDAEIDTSHRFDEERNGLPPRATESMQRRLNYYNQTIREE